MTKLMLVDDDEEVLDINRKYFENKGYQVTTMNNAIDAIKNIPKISPDCIVMDIMMPKVSGFHALPQIRQLTDAPVIFLTGCTDENHKIDGLLLGAEDYMVKPYSLRELEARIIVQLRKLEKTEKRNLLSFPPLTINTTTHNVYYNETQEIILSNKEYNFLALLASKPKTPWTFQEIGESLWGTYSDSDRRTIMVIASRLRKKLADYDGLQEYIETVWSKGYKFNPN